MRALKNHLPLLACLTLAALSLFIPLRKSAFPTPPHPMPPLPLGPAPLSAQASLQLGDAAHGRVALGQGLLPAGVDTVVPLALELTGTSADAQVSRTLVLCVDRSGSMSGDAIRHARSAAHALVDALQPQDEVALVSFSSDAAVDLNVTTATLDGRRAAHDAIDRVAARGGTNLRGGLLLAQQLLGGGHGALRRVVLISDGMPTEGDTRPHAIVAEAAAAARAGHSVTALAVGAHAPGGLMERVAVAGVGNFRFIRDAASLSQALATELRNSGTVALRSVAVNVTLPEGATVVGAQGITFEQYGNRVAFGLGDLTLGETRHALLSVRLPAGAVDAQQVFHTSVTGVRGGGTREAVAQVAAGASSDAAAVARSHVAWVGTQVAVAESAVELKRAADDFSNGDKAGGTQRLNKVAAQMEERARKDMSFAPAARRMRTLADEAAAEPTAGMASNAAHEGAYGLVR